MPKKEINSIREGLRNLVQQMESEKFAELNSKVDRQETEIAKLRAELSARKGEITTLGESKNGIENAFDQKHKDVRLELSSVMEEVKRNRDDIVKVAKKTQDIKGIQDVSDFKNKLEETFSNKINDISETRKGMEETFSKKIEEDKQEMVKLFEKFENSKKELDVVFSNKLKDVQEIIKSLTGRTEGDIGEIKKLASMVKGFREDIEHYNLKKIVTGLEETRSQIQGLESRLNSFQHIIDKLERLESEIEGVKGSFPTILE